jgi:hypothetical protein
MLIEKGLKRGVGKCPVAFPPILHFSPYVVCDGTEGLVGSAARVGYARPSSRDNCVGDTFIDFGRRAK